MKTYDDVADFHGHSCPGLALGYRVSIRALKEFEARSEDEELAAIVENNSCAVDAVQVMTGCTFGKGNLIFRDYGKHVYTFFERYSGRSIRISIDWEKPEETDEEKAMMERYVSGERSKKILGFVHDRKAARIKHLMDAEDSEIMKVRPVKFKIPPEAEIRQSLRCSSCKEKMMETRARVRNNRIVCIPCFERKGK